MAVLFLWEEMRYGMEKKIVVVFDKITKEIIACISLSGQDTICRKDVDFKIYNGTEPIFTEIDSGVKLNENNFMMNLSLEK